MKKIIAFSLVFITSFLVACSENEQILSGETTILHFKNEVSTEGESVFELTENFQTDVGGGEIVQEKYRQCYYNISYQLSLLVDEDEFRAWQKEVCDKDRNDVTEMFAKSFVQHFDISREDFDKANLELAKGLYDPDSPGVSMNPKDYANQEMYEIYNSDIIYSFDDEKINNYYLSGEYPYTYESEFEEAVANGEYTSQTEEWVDVEQMEAEIIAKYGETEFVTEATTVEEQTVAETAQ